MGDDPGTARKGRLSQIVERVHQKNITARMGMPEDELLGWIMTTFGSTHRLAKEYLLALAKGAVLMSQPDPQHGRVYWVREEAPTAVLERRLTDYTTDLEGLSKKESPETL